MGFLIVKRSPVLFKTGVNTSALVILLSLNANAADTSEEKLHLERVGVIGSYE